MLQTDRQKKTDGQTDRRTDNKKTDRQTDRRIDGRTDRWTTGGRTDGRTNKQTDRQKKTDGQTDEKVSCDDKMIGIIITLKLIQRMYSWLAWRCPWFPTYDTSCNIFV
jgi:hypothetical protein